jgi:hypothetical protein
MKYLLQPSVTRAATATGTALSFGPAGLKELRSTRSLIFTLDITSAERDSADETYDFYVTTSDGTSSWDIAHFPQITATGAKRYTMRVNLDSLVPQNVTTASPGVAAVDSASLRTDTAGSNNGIKTLTAGSVRHGAIGDTLNHELVVGGTVATGIVYSLTVEAR